MGMRMLATLLGLVVGSACQGPGGPEGDASPTRASPTPGAQPSPTPSGAEGTATPSPPPGDGAFRVARQGCSMSHCDPALSDRVGLPSPVGAARILWHDEGAAGSNYGLGCSSNGAVVACSMGGNGRGGPYLKVYDAAGEILWSSDLMGFFSFASAPMVAEDGGVIAADTSVIARFDPRGGLVWKTETPGGIPISPVLTDGGALVLAGLGGPVSAYDAATGEALGSLSLPGEYKGQAGAFNSRNTPCVKGNRIYASTEFLPQGADPDSDDPEDRPARLYAIDVDPAAPAGQRLKEVWHFEFGARSGSSPLCMGGRIYFDGDRLTPGGPEDPHVFALDDLGEEPSEIWRHPMPGFGFASAVADPRGGLWAFGVFEPWLLHLDADTGEELQAIDLDALVNARGEHVPLSAMSVAEGPSGQPVMLVTAAEVTSRESYLTAVDLASGGLLWKVRYGADTSGWGAGQFPVALDAGGAPVVVFTTAADGIYAVGGP